ncbi:MAG: GntR family transcriptional regulator, partial [Nocardioidaceae bacterium]|nr:GntR family transcriptional regulator [Nocardioidaceae bacterium]
RRCDSLLHLALAELAGSPTLLRLLADSRIQINALLDSFPLLEPNIVNSDEQHRSIVSAVLAGDPDVAGAAMVSHLAGTAALIRGFWT